MSLVRLLEGRSGKALTHLSSSNSKQRHLCIPSKPKSHAPLGPVALLSARCWLAGWDLQRHQAAEQAVYQWLRMRHTHCAA